MRRGARRARRSRNGSSHPPRPPDGGRSRRSRRCRGRSALGGETSRPPGSDRAASARVHALRALAPSAFVELPSGCFLVSSPCKNITRTSSRGEGRNACGRGQRDPSSDRFAATFSPKWEKGLVRVRSSDRALARGASALSKERKSTLRQSAVDDQLGGGHIAGLV